jgi:uncharacterized protein YeaO (DUF488 family)
MTSTHEVSSGADGRSRKRGGERLAVQVRRVYEGRSQDDGTRVLVDRLWPRGLSKVDAAVDVWCKEVAPSTELRKWYAHDPARFEEFEHRYEIELRQPERVQAVDHLRELMGEMTLTLLTATKRPEISEAFVLATILRHTPPSAQPSSARSAQQEVSGG